MSLPAPQRLRVEFVDGITLVSIVEGDLLAEDVIQEVGEQLLRLVEVMGEAKLVISFRDVRYMSSAMVGQLVKLRKKVAKAKGRMILCGFSPVLREVFRISQLDRLLEIQENEQLALDRF
ncbi:MAG TPA: STAS domain-containing protein [Isosphaeraceae bacterium]|nr:STAS domain-containing protein [Isosphaeraceae bacterium]